MRITAVETLFVDRYLFVQVHTDAGITGLGESGAWGFLEASAAAVDTFARYLVGRDPLRIEHHWQYLYRWSHFRGAAIMGALSAVDIALWGHCRQAFRGAGVPAPGRQVPRPGARLLPREREHQGGVDPGLHRRPGARLHGGRAPDAVSG